jgi:DNA polymerase-3 subunit beta
MKISTQRELLVKAVSVADRLVGKKESLPVLSCILFDVGSSCVITATNLESSIEVRLASDVKEQGRVAVPANILSQTLRSLSGEHVVLETDEDNLVISSKGSRTLLKAVPNDEFPPFSGGETSEGFSINKDHLLEVLSGVSYAASPSMIRPELGSVHVTIHDGVLTAAATDSFRLAEKTVRGAGDGDASFLVPLRHANELIHTLEHIDDVQVSITIDDSQLVVTTGGTRFAARTVEGTFPNYTEVIPKVFVTEATVLKSDLTEVFRKARVFADKEQHISFHIYPKRKEFLATAQSASVGEMSDAIEAALTGEELDINFHIGYLSDCLNTFRSDSVTLCFAGIGKPLVVRGVSDASFMYLAMPLNR